MDLTKFIINTEFDSFKNNGIRTGNFTISGTNTSGTNVRTFNIDLSVQPDMTDIVFNGPSAVFDRRPNNGWFKRGYVYVATDNAGGGSPSAWLLTTSLIGTTLSITATYPQQFSTSEVMVPTTFFYRVLDYSVF